MNRDELLERAREFWLNHLKERGGAVKYGYTQPELLADFALQCLSVAAGEWHPINELPKESGEYIVVKKRGDGTPGEVVIRYINVDEEMTRNTARQYYLAWRQIPEYSPSGNPTTRDADGREDGQASEVEANLK